MTPKVIFLVFFYINLISIQAINEVSFTVDLIHRDSPKSPFYNPSHTSRLRMNHAVSRSISRITCISKPLAVNQPVVIPDGGEYLMRVSIGTPPVEVFGIVDTGSDLTWTPCQPCTKCYKQSAPIFNPKKSSTYKDVSCSSNSCKTLLDSSCRNAKCMYNIFYADNSNTVGNVATDTLTINGTPLPNTVFGCGHFSNGTFLQHRGAGIIGLGAEPLSLISQMSPKIGGKFSYCLVPYEANTSSSRMSFGQEGIVRGAGVVSTPLVQMDLQQNYYLTLDNVSVGRKKVAAGAKRVEGNFIIDSGTTLTFLQPEFYNGILSALKQGISLTPVKDPEGQLDLCYAVSNINDLKAPLVTFHFKGADVVLQPVNVFMRVDEKLVCLGMLPDDSSGVGVFGNVAQINFLVGYDLQARTLSFKRTDCTKN
ncbi:hypothetical protein ACHQM5_007986 [Ranunculus cassubicifolius]